MDTYLPAAMSLLANSWRRALLGEEEAGCAGPGELCLLASLGLQARVCSGSIWAQWLRALAKLAGEDERGGELD